MSGEVLPEGTEIRRDFTHTIRTRTRDNHLGAIPWIAVLERPQSWRSCEALTARRRPCKRRPRLLYLYARGGAASFCLEHTQHALHTSEEWSRLLDWEKRVGFETDRYVHPQEK